MDVHGPVAAQAGEQLREPEHGHPDQARLVEGLVAVDKQPCVKPAAVEGCERQNVTVEKQRPRNVQAHRLNEIVHADC